jgi:hypothetical protein
VHHAPHRRDEHDGDEHRSGDPPHSTSSELLDS